MQNLKPIYFFDSQISNNDPVLILGNKGAGLWKLFGKVPVPYGFVITDAFYELLENNRQIAKKNLEKAIKKLIKRNNIKNFDLFSVRSSPFTSLPGVLPTVINVSLSQESYFKNLDSPKLITSFSKQYLETLADAFTIKPLKKQSLNSLKESLYKSINFSHDQLENILKLIEKFNQNWKTTINLISQNIPKELYKKNLPIILQSMILPVSEVDVFQGVIFSKDPSINTHNLIAEISKNSQGSIVNGTLSPIPMDKIKNIHPRLYNKIHSISKTIEYIFKEPQDIEFSFDGSEIYILQSRNLVYSPKSSKIPREFFLLKSKNIIQAVFQNCLSQKKKSSTLIKKDLHLIAQGKSISAGIVSGQAIFTPEKDKKFPSPILFLRTAFPGMTRQIPRILGIVTEIGGQTSHIAIYARTNEIPFLTKIKFTTGENSITCHNQKIHEGDWVTIDANSNKLYLGKTHITKPSLKTNSNNQYEKRILPQIFKDLLPAITDTKQLRRIIAQRTSLPKGIGLELLHNMGLNIPKIFKKIPKKDYFPKYSIRTSFSLKDTTRQKNKNNFDLNGKFNIPYAQLPQALDTITQQFKKTHGLKPNIIIHETHKIIYSGNILVNRFHNEAEIEIWHNYDKNTKPLKSIKFILSSSHAINLLLDFSIPQKTYLIPFAQYCLEFVVLPNYKVSFTELHILY